MHSPSIQWTEKTERLTALRPFERNPRRITEPQFKKLIASLIEHGQFRPLLVTHDLRLAGGHQRIKGMMELGWETCRISVPDRPITDAQYQKLILLDNHNNGVWDMDILANDFELEMLRDVGIHDIMNIPPMDGDGNDEAQPGKSRVKCPVCSHEFPVRGNKA